MGPRRRAEMGVILRMGEHLYHLRCQRIGVEEIHQQAGFTVGHGLAHRGHVRGDDRGLHRHGLEQGPRQHEGHRQIDVTAADLHELLEVGIGHFAHEMHAVPIDPILQLRRHLSAQTAGVIALLAVGDLIAADDHHPRMGPLGQDTRQGAHHRVKAAGLFQIARDIGDDLILARHGPRQTPQTQAHIRVGQKLIGADAVVTDIELAVKALGKTVALPIGRAMAQIDGFDIGQRHDVAGMVEVGRMGRDFLGRVKTHHPAGHVIVILEITDDRHIRPKLFEETQLPPADVTNDDVRAKSLSRFDLLGGVDGTEPIA